MGLLEGKRGTNQPSNFDRGAIRPHTIKKDSRITMAKKDNIMNDVQDKAIKYKENQELYGGVYDGDGLYQVILTLDGYFSATLTDYGKSAEPGVTKETDRTFIMFVKAYSSVDHPDQPTRSGDSIGISAAEDAQVKAAGIFTNEINNYLDKNTRGYNPMVADRKGVEIGREKMSDEAKLKKMRKDLQNHLGRIPKQVELMDYYSTGKLPKLNSKSVDTDDVKIIDGIIKTLQNELSGLIRNRRMKKIDKDKRKSEINNEIERLRNSIN